MVSWFFYLVFTLFFFVRRGGLAQDTRPLIRTEAGAGHLCLSSFVRSFFFLNFVVGEFFFRFCLFRATSGTRLTERSSDWKRRWPHSVHSLPGF